MSDKAQKLPQFIDPFRLADVGRIYDGDLSLQQMKRLSILLADTETASNDKMTLSLEFGKDINGIHFLSGTIIGKLNVLCQRCLNKMEFPINVVLSIAFLASEFDGDKLSGEYEPCIVTDTPILLSDIMEDELLLALPTIPKHKDSQCSAQLTRSTQTKSETVLEDKKDSNPFSILKDLNK